MNAPILFADSERDGTPPPEEFLAAAQADRSRIDDGTPVTLAGSVSRLDALFFDELATDERATGVRSYHRLLTEGDAHPSKVLELKSKPSDRFGELYTRMLETNLDLSGYFDKRIDAVMKLPRQITPGDGSPLAREVAEFCIAALGVVKDFEINLRHQLLSIAIGNAFDELVLEKMTRGPLAGAWVPVDLIDRPMWRFLYRDRVLHVRQGPGQPSIPAPPGKFLAMRYGTKDTGWSPGLLDDCYWGWFLSKRGYLFWSTFLDKYGMPLAVGKYPRPRAGATGPASTTTGAQQAELLRLLQLMRSEYAIAIPNDLEVDFLEAKRSGGVSYETFLAILDRSMAKKILGEVHTSGAGKGPGSFSIGEVANEVRFEKVVLDARNFQAHLRDNLLKPLVLWNYGPDAPVPYWVIDTLDGEDRKQRREGIEMVLAEGKPVPTRHFYQSAQVPEPAAHEPVVVREKTAAPAPLTPEDPNQDPSDNDPNHDPAADPNGDDAPAAAARRRRGIRRASQRPALTLAAERELRDLRRQADERDADASTIAETIAQHTTDYYSDWRTFLVDAAGDLRRPTLLRDLVGAVNPLASARAIETAQIHGLGLALSHVAQDLELETTQARQRGRASLLELPPGWDAHQNDPQSALDYWAGQLVIDKGTFLGLTDALRRCAFTVAGVTDLDLLQSIYLLIGEAIANGLSRDQFVAAVDGLFKAKGLTPLAKWHIELVYANNVRQAMNLMRYQQLVLNPAARRLTPYLMWLVLHRNTRPEHLVMDEYVAAIDHEIWRMWWPPAGHNCGCYIASITRAKARRLGYLGSEPMGPWPTFEGAPVLPDPGFRGAPGTVIKQVTDDLALRALDAVDGARASGSDDFADAADQLASQLLGSNKPSTLAAFLREVA